MSPVIKKISLFVLALFIFGDFRLFFSSLALAADKTIAIEPAVIEMKGQPGENIKKQFMIINRGNLSVRLKLRVSDFKVKDNNKKIEFYDQGEQSMKNWLLPEFLEIYVKPFETKNIRFIAAIPENINSGSHLGAILFEPVSGNGDFAGLPILLNVLGGQSQATGGGKIENFNVSIIQSDSLKFGVRLANLGNTYLKAQGTILLKDWRGRTIADLKTSEKVVYPDNTGLINWKWGDPSLKIGVYKAEIELANSQNKNNKFSASAWFVVFPWRTFLWWFVGAAVVFAVFLAFRKKIYAFISRAGTFLVKITYGNLKSSLKFFGSSK
jgi:hypothetical protein